MSRRNLPRKLMVLCETAKFIFLYPLAKILNAGKSIYIVSERGDDARDNGYYMFRYLRTNHPELDVYYVITNDSVDLDKVKELGNIVYFGTLKHYIVFLSAKVRVSTHLSMCAPDGSYYRRLREIGLLPGKRVCLKHGITKDNQQILAKKNAFLDLLISGAEPEYRFLLENFGYDETVVKYTGFARFDGLHDLNIKRQILLMPTWRRTLRGVSQTEFLESMYFQRWNELLNDRKLISCLEDNDVELIFYPHYEVQPYIENFKSSSKMITIASKSKYDVQALLKQTSLLVTDFSSVYFDYAYMQKPVIYYQFDEEEFFAIHYDKGYFNYRTMGFGPVFVDSKSVIDEIFHAVENNFAVKESYLKRMIEFFPLNDKYNCERIYNEIQKCVK